MSFDTRYNPKKMLVAEIFFREANRYAKHPAGAMMLAQCAVEGFIVRGSAAGLLQSPIFKRAIDDIDLSTYSRNPAYHVDHIRRIVKFVSKAVEDSRIRVSTRARAQQYNFLERKLIGHIYPRIDMVLAYEDDSNPANAITICVHAHLHLGMQKPDFPPPAQADFIKTQDPYFRLAEKIRALHNTTRVIYNETPRDQKIRRALDMLDTYQAYHIALADAGSHEGVVVGLNKVFYGSRLSQFNSRTTLSIIQHNWRQGFLYGDLAHFDETQNMEGFLPELMAEMQGKGMFMPRVPINASDVYATAHRMMDIMPLPVSRGLVALRHPSRTFSALRKRVKSRKPQDPK